MSKKNKKINLDPEYILKDPGSVQVMYRPVVVEGYRPIPNPTSQTFLSDREWWQEQIKRCLHGWVAPDGKYLNPIYYFFLNFVYVDIFDEMTKKQDWMRPYYRDGDERYFNEVFANMYKVVNGIFFNAKDTIVAKGRRKGWSTSEWGIEMWWIIFRQQRNTLRAYANEEQLKKERPILEKMYNKIHPFWKYNEDNIQMELILTNNENLVQGYKIGSVKMPVNKIMLTVVDAKGTGARGESIEKITVIEAGTHEKLSSFIGASQDTLRQGLYKFGMMLVGGTSDSINNKTTDYKTLFFNAKKNNFKAIFTPSNVCFQGCIDYYTGKSLKEQAAEIIISERKLKAHDQKALKMFIQENPLNVYESFIPSTDSEYDKAKIDEQLLYIYENGLDEMWSEGRFERLRDASGEYTDKVVFKEDVGGNWMMLKGHGLPDTSIENLYVIGIDDVYKDKAPHSESLNAVVVYKRDTSFAREGELYDLPVCFYLGRHPNRKGDWKEFKNCIDFYSNCKVMFEHNDSSGFIGFARDEGIIEKFIYVKGEIGIRVSDQSVADMTYQAINFFEEDRHKRVLHSMLLDSFNRWRAENSDLASAFHLVLLALSLLKKVGTGSIQNMKERESAYTDNGVGFGQRLPINSPFKFGRN